MLELIIDVNTGEPAAISRMAVVPSSDPFSSITHILSSHVINHVLISFISSIDSGLGGFDGKCECVHNHECAALSLALEKTHDFNIATRFSVHDHFQKSYS